MTGSVADDMKPFSTRQPFVDRTPVSGGNEGVNIPNDEDIGFFFSGGEKTPKHAVVCSLSMSTNDVGALGDEFLNKTLGDFCRDVKPACLTGVDFSAREKVR